jgi:glycerate 2-kinase
MYNNKVHRDIEQIFQTALMAVEPFNSVCKKFASSSVQQLLQKDYQCIYIVGCGKAVIPMANATEKNLQNRITDGLAITKYGHLTNELPKQIRVIEAGHPEPDDKGFNGTNKVKNILQKAGKDDLVIALISGGGSALWPLPAQGISLDDNQTVTRLLLASGASIHEVNAVRKHLSAIKGGQAAALAAPADVLVMVISDVTGDALDVIASGPFCPDNSTFSDAWQVIEKYALEDQLPDAVNAHLQQGLQGKIPETPKAGDPVFEKVRHVMCATNKMALEAAKTKAEDMGYNTLLWPELIVGEAKDTAVYFVKLAKDKGAGQERPFCLIAGGETTVTLSDDHGVGGRNQELALSAAFHIAEKPKWTVASLATDGNDGPTDAAGAIVDSQTINKAEQQGLKPADYLERHDAYSFFKQTGELFITGPTNTNVMDVQVAVCES